MLGDSERFHRHPISARGAMSVRPPQLRVRHFDDAGHLEADGSGQHRLDRVADVASAGPDRRSRCGVRRGHVELRRVISFERLLRGVEFLLTLGDGFCLAVFRRIARRGRGGVIAFQLKYVAVGFENSQLPVGTGSILKYFINILNTNQSNLIFQY